MKEGDELEKQLHDLVDQLDQEKQKIALNFIQRLVEIQQENKD